jgi:uncharacterized protein YkwD
MRVPTLSLGVLAVTAALAAPSAHAGTASGPSCKGADVPATAQSAAATRSAIACLVDAARVERNLPVLKTNARLQTAAQRFARTLDPAKPLTHAGPGGSTPLSRIADAGYARGGSGFSAAETLGRSKGSLATPSTRVRKWLAAAATRKLLLSAKYRDVGVGVVTAGDTATFVVEVAKPLASSALSRSRSSR